MPVVSQLLRRRLSALVLVAASVMLTNCRIDELLKPTELGNLVVSTVDVLDSARVGSTAQRTQTVTVGIQGAATLRFIASAELGSAWIVGGLGGANAPNDLTLTLDPSGLAVGEYRDTLRIAGEGPDARVFRVPLSFVIQPCAITDLGALPASTSAALGTEDCASTDAADRFSKRYRFTAEADDSITVRVTNAAFGARVLLRAEGATAALADSDACAVAAGTVCARYVRLPGDGAYEIEVTATAARATGGFDLTVVTPSAPAAPTALAQRATPDTSVSVAGGASIATDRLALLATLTDPDLDSLQLQVELRPMGTAFTGAPTMTSPRRRGPRFANTITGLSDDVAYRWQARAVDETGRMSAWVAFGDGSAADFAVAIPQPPLAPSGLVQRRSDGVTAIALGGTTDEPIVQLGAEVSDPDPGDVLRLELEVRPLGTPFSNLATASSAPSASGATPLVTIAGLADNVQYRWQARTVDQTGRASAWVAFGGAGTHFRTAFPPAQLAFDGQPSDAAAGAAITPSVRVAVQDASGNTLASYTGAVTVALNAGGSGAALGGTTTVNAVAGIATFTDLSVDVAGSGYTLTASVGSLTATSAAFNVTSAAGASMTLGGVPASVVAGATIAPAMTVTVRDALGNVATGFTGTVSLALAPNTAGATLLGTTSVAAVAGVATFDDLRIERSAADLVLVASATGLANVTAPIDVVAAAAATVRIVTTPSTNTASGVPFARQPQIALDDAFGNQVRLAGTGVTATIARGQVGGSLLSPAATTGADGLATFSGLGINGPTGTYTLAFSAASLTSDTSQTLNITAGAAAQLAIVTQPPATAVNGEGFSASPIVRLLDAAGNPVAATGVAITVSIATGGGTLLGTLSVVTNTAGEATFSDLGILGSVGARTLAFASGALTGATSTSIALSAGHATTLALQAGDGQTAAAATAVATPPSVMATDTSGNAVAGVDVTFAVTSGGGSINPSTPITTGSNGIAALTSWTLGNSAGANTLTASAADLAGSPVGFTATATAGAASVLTITGGDNLSGPVGTELGTPHEVRVTDATGNPVAGVTITWTANGGGSVAPTSSVTDADGRATTTRTLGPTAGEQTTVASAALVGGATEVTFTINATVGGATQLALVGGDAQVDTVGATLPISLSVIARDALNNPVEGVLISWSVLSGGGSLAPSTSLTDADGIATTAWTLGTLRTPTDSTQLARASGVGSPVPFIATAQPGGVNAAQTLVSVAPTSVAASRTTPATVTVTARDGFGNPIPNIPVTFAATGAGNTIAQPASPTAANGVTTGAIGASVTGARTITATVGGIVANATPTLTVIAAPAAELLFLAAPSAGVAGTDLSPVPSLGVLDSLGNRNLAFTGMVTLGLVENATGATLSGTLTRSAVAGVANFPGVSVNRAGTGYTLGATGTGLVAAESDAFAITPGSISSTQSSIELSSASIVAGSETSTITVTARDASGNPIAGATVVLAATGSGNTVTQPAAVTDASGVATGTISATAIGARTVSATINEIPLDEPASLTVVAGAISSSLSTITGIPDELVAGVETSNITVTVRDALGNPVAGATVELSATGTDNVLSQPTAVTNASGVATGSFSSTRAEPKTISAAANGVALDSGATVTVTAGAVSAARSLLVATPDSITAGEGTSTVTVTARDANDNLIEGAAVVLAASDAGNTLTQPATTTNASGVTTGALSSTVIGSKTVTATINGIAITASAVVRVVAGGFSAVQSTVAVDDASLVAGDSTTITVTARDASGNPIGGLAVTIAATGDGNTLTQPAALTDADGIATGQIVVTRSGPKTVSATVESVDIAQTAEIAVSPDVPDAEESSVAVEPPSIAAGDATATVTVTVRDRFTNVVPGATVLLSASGDNNAITQPAAVTDAAGIATGTISSTTAEQKRIAATAGGTGLADTVSLTVAPASVSATLSTVSVVPASIVAGTGPATITVIARDANGNVVPGAAVTLSATGTGNTLVQPEAVTNASGVATGTLTSTGAGPKVITAVIDEVTVTQTATLTVTAAAISEATSTVAAASGTISAGVGSTSITVTARDEFGNPVPGATVEISATGDGNDITQPPSVTGAGGVAVGSFSSTVSESKTISATAGGVSVTQTATVNVIPDAVSESESEIATSLATIVAGADTATITVTARDANGNVVAGVEVTLESADDGIEFVQPTANTNTSGIATGRAIGELVGVKTVRALINGVPTDATVVLTVTPAAADADSTLIAVAPSTLVAGGAPSTITVTARDAFGNRVPDATVELEATGSGNTLTQPTADTDADGIATGALTSTGAGIKTISAVVGGTAITATATLTVTPAVVDAARSIVEASPDTIVAGGGASTVTVTARDQYDNVISGLAVTLAASGDEATLTQPPSNTNASGVATGSVAATITGDRVISATIGDVTITQTDTVTVVPAAISGTLSTIGAEPTTITAGGTPSAISVTVRDLFGNVVPGINVVLAASGINNTLDQPDGPTDGGGVATGALTSITAQSQTVNASAGGVALSTGVVVTVAPGAVSATNSSIVADPVALTAGTGSSTITVTARDANNNLIPDATVALSATGDGNSISEPTATNASGQSTSSFSSTGAGSKTISATINTVLITPTATVTVNSAAVSASASSVEVADDAIPAGSGSTVVTVTVRDAFGNPISGAAVAFAASGSGNTLTPPSAVTDALGVAASTFASTNAEVKTVSATAGGVALADQPTVTVEPDVASASNSLVAALPTSIVAGAASDITVTVRDASGNAVSGVVVTLESPAADVGVTQPIGVTGTDGIATGSITATVVGAKTIRARLDGALMAPEATVDVTPAAVSASQGSVSADPTSFAVGGSGSTITVTVRDAFDNPIPDVTVSFAATGTGNTIPADATTNALGVATGVFNSTVAEAKTISITAAGVALDETAEVTVTPGTASLTASTITADPDAITTDGSSTITVQLRDASNNLLTGPAGTVTLTGSIGDAIGVTDNLDGSYTGTFTSGAIGTATITAALDGVPLTQQATVAVSIGAPSLTTSTLAASVSAPTVGDVVTITVQLRDAAGNEYSTAAGVVTMFTTFGSLSSVTDVGNGTYTATLSSDTPGDALVTARLDGALLTATAGVEFVVGAVSASQSSVVAPAGTITASDGVETTLITVTVRDAFGNLIPNAAVTVTASGTLNAFTGNPGTADESGVFTTAFSSTRAEPKRVAANVGAAALADTVEVTVVPAAIDADESSVALEPTEVVAGVASTVTVTVRDAFGNPIAGVGVTLGATGVGNTVTDPAADTDALGVATGSVSSTASGEKTVSAVAGGVPLADTPTLTVTPGAVSLDSSTVTATPDEITTDGSSTITVQLRDAGGNALTESAGEVTLSASIGNDIDVTDNGNGTYTGIFTSGTIGSAIISAALDEQSLTQRDTVAVAIGAPSPITSTVTASDPSPTVGDVVTITVQLRDAAGNAYATSVGAVEIFTDFGSLSEVVNPGNGTYTATLSSDAPGIATVTAELDAVPLTNSASVEFFVGAVSASRSTVVVDPDVITAGTQTSTITITVLDGLENPIEGATVTLTVSGSDNSVTQPIGTTDANGIIAGSIASTRAELKTITATANGVPLTAEPTVTVSPAAASADSTTITADPTAITTDETSSITVRLFDEFGNPLTTSSAAVTLTSTIGGTLTVTPVGDGTYTATLAPTTAGTALVSGTLEGVEIADTAAVTVTAGSISVAESDVSSGAPNIVAGTSTTVDVVVRDAARNPIEGVEVTFAADPDGGFTPAASGITDPAGAVQVTFSATAAGTKTLTIVAGGTTLTDALEIEVTATDVDALVFDQQPSDADAGVAIAPAIVTRAVDAFGNTVTGFTETVTLTIQDGTGTANASFTASSTIALLSVDGVATFSNVAIDSAGADYRLGASSASVTTEAISAAFDITPGTATQLAVVAQPSAEIAGESFTLVVAALDSLGNTDTTFTGDIEITLTSGSGPLDGTLTVAAVAGIATFSDLRIEGAGTDKVLTASSGALATAATAPFTITPGDATVLVFEVEPTETEQGETISPAVVVRVEDAFGNLATTFTDDITLTIEDGTGSLGALLTGGDATAAVGGLATFDSLSIDLAGTGYVLRAVGASLFVLSTTFTITATP